MPAHPHVAACRDADRLAVAASASEAWAESAVSPSTYAVPGRLLWLGDASIQVLALVVAWLLVPALHPWLAAETAGRVFGLGWLAFPRASPMVDRVAFTQIAWGLLLTVPATLLAVEVLGGYSRLLEQSRIRVMASAVLGPIVGLSFVSLALVAVKNQSTSRALIFSFTLLTSVGFLAYRFALRYYKQRRLLAGHYARNLVIAGPAASREWLARHIEQRVSPNIRRLCGYLELPSARGGGQDEPAPAAPSAALPCLGRVADLGRLLVHRPIHEVVAVFSEGADTWLREVIEQCDYFQVTVRLLPEALLSLPAADSQLAFRPGVLGLPEIELRPRYLNHDALLVKRLFDIVVSGTLLVLLLPLFLLIAVVIKLTTPHLPVFYPWRVIGYKGRPFTGYKFTTMVADADSRKADLVHLNEMSGPVFKMKYDPRVTRVGRWLRKYSLNELPQLWSVLKGDMSLVGPRPAYPTELARYELWHKRKLCVQPGITCLWQVRGRNRISSFDEWVRMDFEYIDNWSFWLDCRILARTAWGVIAGTGW